MWLRVYVYWQRERERELVRENYIQQQRRSLTLTPNFHSYNCRKAYQYVCAYVAWEAATTTRQRRRRQHKRESERERESERNKSNSKATPKHQPCDFLTYCCRNLCEWEWVSAYQCWVLWPDRGEQINNMMNNKWEKDLTAREAVNWLLVRCI